MSTETPPIRPLDSSPAAGQDPAWDPHPAYFAPPPSRRGRIWRHAIGLAGFSSLLVLSAALDFNADRVTLPSGAALPELCALRSWTGVSCPGCGLTRCFVSMAHGDVVSAWRQSPAGILFFVLAAAQVPLHLVQLTRAIRGRPQPMAAGRWTGRLLVAVAALLIAQWAWRLLEGI